MRVGEERKGGRGGEGEGPREGGHGGRVAFLRRRAVDEALCIVRLISLAASYRKISEVGSSSSSIGFVPSLSSEEKGICREGERGEKGKVREGGGSARAQACRKKKRGRCLGSEEHRE